jgi:hypothetical protein
MKATELRIGNWVHHNTNWSTRNEIKEELEYQFDDRDWYYDAECLLSIENDLSPIPLTEEWLIKFGFDGQDYNLFTIELSRNQFMMLKDEWLIVISNNCKYVHQLQNLYFALTGEELTIK